MFRLSERQLHSILILVGAVSLLLFGFFGVSSLPKLPEYGGLAGMEDYSTDWLCRYETRDKEKLEKYYKTQEHPDRSSAELQESTTLPARFSVAEGKEFVMTHLMPETNQGTLYMLIKTKRQGLKVYAGEDLIYQSGKRSDSLVSYHVIPLDAQYSNMVLALHFTSKENGDWEIISPQIGTRNQLYVSLAKDDGIMLLAGCSFLLIAVLLLILRAYIRTALWKKRILFYGSLEGILFGILFGLDGNTMSILTGWNYGVNLLRFCIMILLILLHLVVLRCFVNKKKVMSIVDVGILLVGVFYVSILVLQLFGLVAFDFSYLLAKYTFSVVVLVYTIILGVSAYEYGQKECLPVFYLNILLLVSFIVQITMYFAGGDLFYDRLFILLGIVLYMMGIWIMGIKVALKLSENTKEPEENRSQVVAQILEELNPNLLFASFHSLQRLIRAGSDKSIKMLYYISVYLRNNLTALERRGETIPFEEELEHIIAYLQLQKTRNTRLNFSLECKEKEFHVPRHTIEPLVENAVKYGIAGRQGQGNVVIRTYLRAEGYAIQVIDDGVGFDIKQLKRKSPRAILSLFDTLKEQCQAQTEIISKEGKGTVITIIFPMLDNDLLDSVDELEDYEGEI